MKPHMIQSAIDGSLQEMRFDEQDARAVLRAVREKATPSLRRRVGPPRLRLAALLVLLITLPAGLLTLVAVRTDSTLFCAAPDPIATAPCDTQHALTSPALFAWSQARGAVLREALPGELTAQEAALLAETYVRRHSPLLDAVKLFCYPLLRAGRAESGNEAQYEVYCFTHEIGDTVPEPFATVFFDPFGHDVFMRPQHNANPRSP